MKPRRFILGKDYPEICEWWREWALLNPEKPWKYIPVRKLPAIGIVVEDGERKHAAGFVHECDGNWIIFEWLVTNPKSIGRSRKLALDALVQAVKEIAKATGREVFSSLDNKGLIRLFENSGFERSDTDMTNMVWRQG